MDRALGAGSTLVGRGLGDRTGPARGLELPFAGGWRRQLHGLLRRAPRLRGRIDWLALLSDVDFDRRLAAALGGLDLDLLDAVMGQCCVSFRQLEGTRVRRVLTSLNTHAQHLAAVLAEEGRRLGTSRTGFVHPRMLGRVREEIDRADAIRVPSRLSRETFLAAGVPADKVTVIPLPVDTSRFRPLPAASTQFRVIAVSTIEPRKGVHYLLEAWSQARLPDSELLIVGGTADRWSRSMLSGYQARLSNLRVEQMDVPTTPVERHYGWSSVLVHAAIEDGFGYVVGEAMACGRPVIVTRQSGASELVEDGRNGFLVEARDVSGLVDRLRQLHADRALRESMAAAAPQAVQAVDYEPIAEQVRALHRRVLELS